MKKTVKNILNADISYLDTEKYIKIPFDDGVVWEMDKFHKALRYVIYNSRVILDVGSHIGSLL